MKERHYKMIFLCSLHISVRATATLTLIYTFIKFIFFFPTLLNTLCIQSVPFFDGLLLLRKAHAGMLQGMQILLKALLHVCLAAGRVLLLWQSGFLLLFKGWAPLGPTNTPCAKPNCSLKCLYYESVWWGLKYPSPSSLSSDNSSSRRTERPWARPPLWEGQWK